MNPKSIPNLDCERILTAFRKVSKLLKPFTNEEQMRIVKAAIILAEHKEEPQHPTQEAR